MPPGKTPPLNEPDDEFAKSSDALLDIIRILQKIDDANDERRRVIRAVCAFFDLTPGDE